MGTFDEDEQSEEERREVARRYREQRRGELFAWAGGAMDTEPVAVGEFQAAMFESLAAIPLFGAFIAGIARLRAARRSIGGLTPTVLVALDGDLMYVLGTTYELPTQTAKIHSSYPRSTVQVSEIKNRGGYDQVKFEISGEDKPLILYASSLRTNPWATEVVRMLGGDTPPPRDLG